MYPVGGIFLSKQLLLAPASYTCFSHSKLPQVNLSNADDIAWKDREAAVLALGAIAEGCIHGLFPHLPQVIFYCLILISLVLKEIAYDLQKNGVPIKKNRD